MQLTIDGGPANVTSQTSNGSAIFNVLYFETPLLTETFHTAVITNLGSTTNGSMTEFELDRFEFQTSDVVPLFSPPVGSITSVAPSATSSSTAHTSSSSFKSRLEAIAGGVIGALILIIVFLVYILWRKIKERSAKRESRGGTFQNTCHSIPTADPRLLPLLLFSTNAFSNTSSTRYLISGPLDTSRAYRNSLKFPTTSNSYYHARI